MNKNNNYNINCLKHGNENIIYLCIPCKKPICGSCVVDGSHINHKNEKNEKNEIIEKNDIQYIDKSNIKDHIIDFKESVFPKISRYIESNLETLRILEICKKELSPIDNNKITRLFSSIHTRLEKIKQDLYINIETNNTKVQINKVLKSIKNIPFFEIISQSMKGSSMLNKLYQFNDSYIYLSHGEEVPKNQNKLMIDYRVDYNNFTVPDHIEEIHLLKNQKLKNNDNNNIKTLYLHDMEYSPISFKNIENCYRCYKNKNENYNKNEFEIVKQYKLHGWDWLYTINDNILNNFTVDEILPSFHTSLSFLFTDIQFSNKLYLFFEKLKNKNYTLCFCFIKQFDSKISNLINDHQIKELFLFDIENQIESIPQNSNSVMLKGNFKYNIKQGVLHDNIKILFLYNNTEISFEENSIHQNLKIVLCGPLYLNKIKGVIPDHIILDKLDHELTKDHIPNGVKIIQILNEFNQILKKEILPPSLKLLQYQADVDIDLIKDLLNRKSIKYNSSKDINEVLF